jgi:archaellum component FlaG (FlaF/FlaG flagellin family)
MCANVDSVFVTLLIPDLSVERLFNPTDGCGYSETEHVEFYILNTGTDTLQTNDTVFVSYQFDGGSLEYDTLVMDMRVVPGDSTLFSSTGTVDVDSTTTYQFSVDALYGRDLIPENNHLDQSIEVFNPPTVSLGDDQVVNSARYTLDPGAGFMDYLWQDGSTDQQFVADHVNQTPDSTYGVVVTDMHGCQASDEVKIGFDLWDLGVSSILTPVSGCSLTEEETLSLFVMNYGMHPIVNESVSVTVSMDRQTPVTVLRTLTQVLNPGDSVEFRVGFTFDLSAKGDHNLTAYSIYGQDADPYTDTLEQIITHLGLPAPELGGVNDTLGTQIPYTLDAGVGFSGYIWNGEIGEQTHDAAQYGWYKLEVIDPDGCYGRDSIYLTSVTGVEDHQLPGDLSVYPIPASRYLHVEYSYAEAEDLVLDLYDSNGRIVLNRQFSNVKEFTETIDVGDIARGVYYLRLRSDEKEVTRLITLY